MQVSRRIFLQGSAAAAAAAMVPTGILARSQAGIAPTLQRVAPAGVAPDAAQIALHRMAYGPRPGDAARVRSMGIAAYIEEQLNPAAINDADCEARLAAARMRIQYEAGTGYSALSELRPLGYLQAGLSTLWKLTDGKTPLAWTERVRPSDEVRAATWIRALYSKRQLQEVLADFWHNHFNVATNSADVIHTTLPLYDRDVIRKNCFGNFRAFLGDVATSHAMLYYLNNLTNRTTGGKGSNENYARELFELHTLGSDNYLKFVTDRRQIPLDQDGNPRGYIDDDVYEAARCLSGWTIANGEWSFGFPEFLPNTGEFLYYDDWHDNNPKTVLSPDGYPNFPARQAPMHDGMLLLDLLANHRGTARNVCTKLCRRLISDDPPRRVVDAAVDVWMNNRTAPDQIKQVVRVILLSPEFQSTWGQKVKRPFETFASFLRATGAELQSDSGDLSLPTATNWSNLLWLSGRTGQRLFDCTAPTGYPDVATYWLNSNSVLRQWSFMYGMTTPWAGNVQIDYAGQTPAGATCTTIVDFWVERLCGFAIDPNTRQTLIAFLSQGGNPNQPPKAVAAEPDWGDPAAVLDRIASMVHLLAMSPDFLAR
ncbi:MAG: DUF1800 domain-containing protein [Herpetosiphon sp.]